MAQEKSLDNKVLALIKHEGDWCIKYWAGAKFTKNGIPDILACVDGHFIAVEDKVKTGKPTLLQLKNLEWIREAGGYGILLYPDDFENFKQFLKSIKNQNSTEISDWYFQNLELQRQWKNKLEKEQN